MERMSSRVCDNSRNSIVSWVDIDFPRGGGEEGRGLPPATDSSYVASEREKPVRRAYAVEFVTIVGMKLCCGWI